MKMIKIKIELTPKEYYVFSICVRELKNGMEIDCDTNSILPCSKNVFEYDINCNSDEIEVIFEEHGINRTIVYSLQGVSDNSKFGIRFYEVFTNDDEPTCVYNSEYGNIPYFHPLMKDDIIDYYSIK